MPIDILSLNLGEHNERLQNVINCMNYTLGETPHVYKEIENRYLLTNKWVDRLSPNDSYITKIYDVSDLDFLYIKVKNILNVTPYGWLNADISEENYDDLKNYIVYAPTWLTSEKLYEGLLIKPLGAKYLIITEHKTRPKYVLNKVTLLTNSRLSKLLGKTYWTVFDSLGASNKWQSKFTELSGAVFYPTLNSSNKSPISWGGSNSFPTGDDGGQARLRNLEKLKGKYPIDYIFYENINDVPSTPSINGSLEDLPFMRSEKISILKDGKKFTSNSEAKSYFDSEKEVILNSISLEKRKAGILLNLPYENKNVNAGYTIKFLNTPQSSGTVYVLKGSARYGIDVTPNMSKKDLVNEVLNYSYGAGWGDIAIGDDAVSIYYYTASDILISFDANGTGIQTEITRCGVIGNVYKYFTGFEESEWFDYSKWVDGISLYSVYKGIIEFIKNTFPVAKFYWFIPTRYNVPLDGSAEYVKPDGSFDINKYRQSNDYKHYKALTDCQKEVCKLYDIPILDIESNCGINLFNLSTYYNSNNVHPKDDGYFRWGETVFDLIG